MSLGKNIQKLRKENQLSQEQLAQKCNVSRQTISRWESDEVLPDTNNLITLAKLFYVSLDSLVFTEVKEPAAEKKSKWKTIGIISMIINIFSIICLLFVLNPFTLPKDIDGVYHTVFSTNLDLIVNIEKNDKGYLTKIYVGEGVYPITKGYIVPTKSVVGEMLDYEVYVSQKTPKFTLKYSKENDETIILEADWINNIEKTFYLTRQ